MAFGWVAWYNKLIFYGEGRNMGENREKRIITLLGTPLSQSFAARMQNAA